MDRSLFWIAAVVLFILAVILCFIDSQSVRHVLAAIAAGLACLSIANATYPGR
jgi:hypothetical protein